MGWTQRSAAASVMLAMEDYRRQVGARIRQLREAKGLTQDQLGDIVGVREKTVSRWENGRHTGYISNVRALAEALDVDVQAITGTPPPPLGLGDPDDQLERIEAKLDAIIAHFEIPMPAGTPLGEGAQASQRVAERRRARTDTQSADQEDQDGRAAEN